MKKSKYTEAQILKVLKAQELGKNLKEMSLTEMDIFWNEAKLLK